MIEEKRKHPALYLDLLQVNNFIHELFTRAVYQKNTVVLPYAPLTAKFFQNCLNTVEKRLWLKDVEVGICFSGMSPGDKKD